MNDRETVTLAPMTRQRMHVYFRRFVPDPDLYLDPSLCRPYRYDPAAVDAFCDAREKQADRVFFAVLLDGAVIGDAGLKQIDNVRKTCELSIHLTDDSVKNCGFGTRAERLLLDYAFLELGMRIVKADTVRKNRRSQHVLEKLGFSQTGEDEAFRYYELRRETFEKNRQVRTD